MQIDRIWASSPVTRSREQARGVLQLRCSATAWGLLALEALSPYRNIGIT
jgi:hypothetical protein